MAKPLHSFRCDDSLWAAITAHADNEGISANELMERILEQSLGLSDPSVTSHAKSDVIADIQARLRAVERVIANSDIAAIAKPTSKPIAGPIANNSSDWMTTGEARAAMQQRHDYQASSGTFRRHLRAAQKNQVIPPDLSSFGVVELDFKTRAAANPKSNSVRWIKVS